MGRKGGLVSRMYEKNVSMPFEKHMKRANNGHP